MVELQGCGLAVEYNLAIFPYGVGENAISESQRLGRLLSWRVGGGGRDI